MGKFRFLCKETLLFLLPLFAFGMLEIKTQPAQDLNTRLRQAMDPARGGSLDKVEDLVGKGADVNSMGFSHNILGYKTTPLVEAAYYKQWPIVKFLVEKGANVNSKAEPGYTALFWAVNFDNLEIAEYLVKNGATIYSELMPAAKSFGVIKLLESKGADITTGGNALLSVISRNDIEAVKYMLAKGVNVNYRDGAPLLLAARSNKLDMVKVLVNAGADVNAKSESRDRDFERSRMGREAEPQTALGWAKRFKNQDMIKFLEEHGAKEEKLGGAAAIVAPTKDAEKTTTEIISAFAKGDFSRIDELTIDALKNFKTADQLLYYAIKHKNLPVVKKLIKKGIAFNDRIKGDCLTAAKVVGNKDIVDFFKSLGAKEIMEHHMVMQE